MCTASTEAENRLLVAALRDRDHSEWLRIRLRRDALLLGRGPVPGEELVDKSMIKAPAEVRRHWEAAVADLIASDRLTFDGVANDFDGSGWRRMVGHPGKERAGLGPSPPPGRTPVARRRGVSA